MATNVVVTVVLVTGGGLVLFHILISSHFLLLASIFEFQCFGLFSGLTCPKYMGLEPLCYSYFCAFLGFLNMM